MKNNQLILIHNLSYSILDELLWSIPNLTAESGDHIGLVGDNGSGKTTLLKIINGDIELDDGVCKVYGKVFLVPQKREIDLNITISDILFKYSIQKYIFDKEYSFLSEKMIQNNVKMHHLSGGEFIKVYITLAKIIKPNILLLDEPTNHIDSRGIIFLENYLKNFNGTYICVSHDIAFLNSSVKKIWAIESGGIKVVSGNYSTYKEITENKQNAALRQFEAKRKELKKAENAIKVENERQQRSISVGKKAKKDNSMSAYEKGYLKEHSEKQAGKNTNKLKNLRETKEDELKSISIYNKRNIRLDLDFINHNGRRLILSINNGQLVCNNVILVSDIFFDIYTGDRIRIKGDNGSGKTLLLKTLFQTESNAQLSGSIKKAPSLSVVYMDQHYDLVLRNASVLENIEQVSKINDKTIIRSHLARFLFRTDKEINKKAYLLSGGELARLAIAILTLSHFDCIILDEPTNNLDISTIKVFTEALADFGGAIVVVSHNEEFCKSIGITKEYAIENGYFKK